MVSNKDIKRSVERIRAVISKGFVLTSADLHFLESSFNISSPDKLTAFINDDDSDLDTIMELIFSPDEKIQTNLETCFQDAAFSNDKARVVSELAAEHPLISEIRFPVESEKIIVEVAPDLIQRFISKLRITNNPPEHIYTLSEALTERHRLTSLVRLRNATISFHDTVTVFFSDLFRNEAAFEDEFLNLLNFSISVIEEYQPEDTSGATDILKRFITKKRSYEKSLETLTYVEKKLKTSAVETMMMQGTRIPPVSKEAVSGKIKMAETILAVLFGYIDSPRTTPSKIDLGSISDKKEIQKAFRLLS